MANASLLCQLSIHRPSGPSTHLTVFTLSTLTRKLRTETLPSVLTCTANQIQNQVLEHPDWRLEAGS